MQKDPIIAVLGGDVRQLALARYFADAGYRVRLYALPHALASGGFFYCNNWKEAIRGACAVVLPLPASRDGMRVFCPEAAEGESCPPLDDLLAHLSPGTLLAGGKLPQMSRADIAVFDYFASDTLQQKNAVPTAEGAVQILMQEVPRTVNGLPVAVIGYGRVGQALVSLLSAMGANVTVAARSPQAREAAAACGARAVFAADAPGLIAASKGQAAVFNTAPALLFDEAVLPNLSPETLLVDLASAPGGVDVAVAAACGVRTIFALSLPGKYAPVTAGELIAETVHARLREEGMP